MAKPDTNHRPSAEIDRPPLSPKRRVGSQKLGSPASKSDAITRLLARVRGATLAEVSEATGWQQHSVRAFLSGLRKRGLSLAREARKDGTTSYRLVPIGADSIARYAAPASTAAPASEAGIAAADATGAAAGLAGAER
ncbi:MAG: DUF3489 domain-containing protein [Sandarakinorhabdus sp.]|nr:DUF3489 domain-containing protein [Sandarakinorhabdus sp.]